MQNANLYFCFNLLSTIRELKIWSRLEIFSDDNEQSNLTGGDYSNA